MKNLKKVFGVSTMFLAFTLVGLTSFNHEALACNGGGYEDFYCSPGTIGCEIAGFDPCDSQNE